MIVTHPETGKKLLYVNSGFTTRIKGMAAWESEMLLNGLTNFIATTPSSPVGCNGSRTRWCSGTIAAPSTTRSGITTRTAATASAFPSSAPNDRQPERVGDAAAPVAIPIKGLAIGHAADAEVCTGTTVILPDAPAVASAHVVGGSPGTRETDLLNPQQLVEKVDAVVLSGGSAFGLDAASGAQAWLAEAGRGFPVPPKRVPIVPAAILFDLNNGGNKDWGRYPPYRDLGFAATASADRTLVHRSGRCRLGATTATTPGGLGIASETLPCGATVMSVMAVNAAGLTANR